MPFAWPFHTIPERVTKRLPTKLTLPIPSILASPACNALNLRPALSASNLSSQLPQSRLSGLRVDGQSAVDKGLEIVDCIAAGRRLFEWVGKGRTEVDDGRVGELWLAYCRHSSRL